MMNTSILLFLFLLIGINVNAQDGIYHVSIPQSVYSTAFKMEVMKDGSDCSIISYVPQEFNRTLTPRDDKNLGEFYFHSALFIYQEEQHLLP